jgi:hypothetical protein
MGHHKALPTDLTEAVVEERDLITVEEVAILPNAA